MLNFINRRHSTLHASFILTMIVVGVGGCASDRAVINQANEAHSGLKPAVLDDPQLAGYLQEVGDRIIRAARDLDQNNFGPESHRSEDTSWMFSQGMKFHFVNSKTLNAFTTGGEHMYIYSELFQQCKSEDELAAVMAHEFAHVYARHVHKGMNRQYTIIGGALAAGAAGAAIGGRERGAEYGLAAAGGAAALGQFIGMGYTRSDETEADKLGFTFYAHAGWDPKKFGDFFQQMIDKGLDTTPEMMSDHPSLASRVQAAQRYAAELGPEARQWRRPPVADDAKLKRLQARAADFAKSMPQDNSLEGAQTLLASFGNCMVPVDQPEQVRARRELGVYDNTADASNQAVEKPRKKPKPKANANY